MGYGSYTASDWTALKKSRGLSEKNTLDEVFNSVGAKNKYSVYNAGIRESRDSMDSPQAVPIIIGFDVTSSMGYLAKELAVSSLNMTVQSLYKKGKPEYPHIMCAAIGDCKSDRYPLQVTQFEADIRIISQLTELYPEGGGGGNDGESYNLLWYFAARHTCTDHFEKRNTKGILITIGDDKCHSRLSGKEISSVFGDKDCEYGFSNEELLKMAERKYHVFHIVIEKGDAHDYKVLEMWQRLMKGKVTVIRKEDIGFLHGLIGVLTAVGLGENVSKAFEGMSEEIVKCLSRSAAMLVRPSESEKKIITF